LIGLMEGVEDIPGTALAEGIRWQWESFPEYLDALDSMPRSLDVAAHLPHGALRAYVMGERGANDEPATVADLAALRTLALEGLTAGAVGISTSRTAGHLAVDGRPVPGTHAAQQELWALGDALVQHGRGLLQLAPAEMSGDLAGDAPGSAAVELDWMVRFARDTQRTVTFLVLQSSMQPDSWRPWLQQVAAARADGVPIHPQVGSRCFGVLMGHQTRLNPFRLRPTYAALADLPLAERVHRLRDPEVRARILGERAVREERRQLDSLGTAGFEQLYPLGDQLDYEPTPDQSVAARARAAGRDVWDLAYDLLLEDEGRELLLFPLLNFGHGSYDALHELMSSPLTVQGLGDGGAHCSLVCDASMTTYLLSHWTRDRTRGPKLPLEHAVRRITSDAAALYGFEDRGVLEPGRKADLNLIDHASIGLRRPELVHDLPAGAGRLVQQATGYVATIVSGEVVLADGEATGALPGRLVRA
jgi:N-acyl-D-aspartate/D-glutamate deacylase